MEVNTELLNRLGSNAYHSRVTELTPRREAFSRYTHKEFRPADIAEVYHENTQLTPNTERTDQGSVALFLDEETVQFARRRLSPDYPGHERVSLPSPSDSVDTDLTTAIDERRSTRSFDGTAISRQTLSTLLHYSCGVTQRGERDDTRTEAAFRAYPSGGGLYPVEPYVIVPNSGETLAAGVYYYASHEHVLRRLDGNSTDAIAAFLTGDLFDADDTAVCLVLTGAFWRSKAKYGPRGYRFVHQEAGHIMQNFQLIAGALGLHSVPFASVEEKRLEPVLGVDGVEESVVYTGFAGYGGGDGE